MKQTTRLFLYFAVFVISLSVQGISADAAPEPFLFGVNVDKLGALEDCPACGDFIKQYSPLLRSPFYWGHIEREKGEYRLPPIYSGIRRVAKDNNTKLVAMLGYNNALYNARCDEDKNTRGQQCIVGISDDQNLSAYKNYVSFLVKELGSEVAIWEIWNEENEEAFWRPKPSVNDFVRLVEQTATLIKKIDNKSFVISGGTASVDFDYIEAIIKSGAYKKIDAIGIHVNMFEMNQVRIKEEGKRGAQDIATVLNRLEKLRQKHGVSFIITEFGFPLNARSYASLEGYSPRETRAIVGTDQKGFVDMFNILKQSEAIQGIIIYNLQDTLNKENKSGGIRGLFDHEGHKKRVMDFFPEPQTIRSRR